MLCHDVLWYEYVTPWYVMTCHDVFWNKEFYDAQPLIYDLKVMLLMKLCMNFTNITCEELTRMSCMIYLQWKIWRPDA